MDCSVDYLLFGRINESEPCNDRVLAQRFTIIDAMPAQHRLAAAEYLDMFIAAKTGEIRALRG